jgi:hypothetical protein
MTCGAWRVQVIHVGPLQEEGVVGMNELGVLVRETALSAYKGLKRSLADYSHPYASSLRPAPSLGSHKPANRTRAPSHAYTHTHTHTTGTRCERG